MQRAFMQHAFIQEDAMKTAAATERTSTRTTFLLAFATLCLAIALALAWVLGVTLFFPNGYLAGLIVERADLVRAHIDYLMMAQFLFLFALLFRQYSIVPPWWVVGASCFGAFFNPLPFILRALHPKIDPTAIAEPHFPFQAGLSFSLTTIGFLAAAVLATRAAWLSRTETKASSSFEKE
jgi:hypothetical protein